MIFFEFTFAFASCILYVVFKSKLITITVQLLIITISSAC